MSRSPAASMPEQMRRRTWASAVALIRSGESLATSIALATVAAARLLLPPGLVTLGLLGEGPSAQTMLATIVGHLPDVEHIAVTSTALMAAVPAWLREEIDQAGIGMHTEPLPDDAIFGANLVVVLDAAVAERLTSAPTPGSVVINAAGAALPADLVGCAGRVVLDEPQRGPFRGRSGAGVEVLALSAVLDGECPRRRFADEITLVELLAAQAIWDAPRSAAMGLDR